MNISYLLIQQVKKSGSSIMTDQNGIGINHHQASNREQVGGHPNEKVIFLDLKLVKLL